MTSLSHGTGNACSQVKEGFSSYAIQCTITELSPVSSDQKPVGLCLMLLSRKWFPLVACPMKKKLHCYNHGSYITMYWVNHFKWSNH